MPAITRYYRIGRFAAFHYCLRCGAGFFKNLHHLIEIIKSFVEVEKNFPFAGRHDLAESRHLIGGDTGHAVLHIQCLDLRQCHVGHTPFAVGSAVHLAVVHQNKFAVFGASQIYLHDIRAEADCRLNPFERVFGIIPPIAAMCGH